MLKKCLTVAGNGVKRPEMTPRLVFSYSSQIFITCYIDEEGKDFLSWGFGPGVLYECSMGARDTETALEMAQEVTFSGFCYIFFRCAKHLYKRVCPSIRLSVRP